MVGPCTINCSNDKEIYSFHAGGATTVFADGSVRFMKTTLKLDLLSGLLTRERGENIPTDL